MPKFELSTLTSFDDQNLIDELRRVAKLISDQSMTVKLFDKYAKVDSSTIRKRFGGWREALERAGLDKLYSGAAVTEKMKKQAGKNYSNEMLIEALKSVARIVNTNSFTTNEFNRHSEISVSILRRRFGSWNKALVKAGLLPLAHGRRYTEVDYFENLLAVWTHYGRQPYYSEMNKPPSHIPSGDYFKKWGTWKKALLAFIERANIDLEKSKIPTSQNIQHSKNAEEKIAKQMPHNPSIYQRLIPLGIRYSVLTRDRFRCVKCGSSPATDLACKLHIDHIIPFSKGGLTMSENLQTLCENCNLGKRDRLESN